MNSLHPPIIGYQFFNDTSGAPRVFRDALDALHEYGHQTVLVTSKHQGFMDSFEGCRLNAWYARSNNAWLQLFILMSSQFLMLFKMAALVCKYKAPAGRPIVLLNTLLPFGAAIGARLAGAHVVYYVHETSLRPPLFKKFLRFWVECCASQVIFVSHYLARQESFSRPKSTVIHNGLRHDFPTNPEVDIAAKFSGRRILFAGSLKFYKGTSELIALSKALPNFQFVAALNCSQQDLQNWKISQPTLPTNLQCLARPENLQQLYAQSFVLLNLSKPNAWIESFGLTLIEAMTYSTPVVAPPVGGPTEIVTANIGLLADSSDTPRIASWIQALAEDESRYRRMALDAHNHAHSYTQDAFRQRIRLYFKELS